VRARTLLTAATVVTAGAATLALAVNPSANADTRRPPVTTVEAAATSPAALAAAAADRAAGSGYDALAKGPDESFVRRNVVAGSGGLQYVTYDRTYRGLPVVGGDAIVVTDAAGRIRDALAADHGRVTLRTLTPAVTAAQATGAARAELDSVTTVNRPQLVAYALTATPHLAWEVLAAGTHEGRPSRLHVYVDAQDGRVLSTKDDVVFEAARGFYNGSIQIDTTGGQLRDPNRPGLLCGNNGTHQVYPNGGTGAGTDLQTGCVDAYYAVEREWDMLRTWLGRSGIDGNGRAFPLYVGLNAVNAYWDGSSGTFGHNQAGSQQATNLDVVGHEMGHAIDQYTGAGAAAEAGLGEATGDIFGALTESFANNPNDPPDFTVGEELNLVGTGPIRYMYRPSTNGDPDCYSSAIPGTEVHKAAGPLNHWFYLIAEGTNPTDGQPASPTCNNTTVSGIGLQKAGQVFLAAMNMKTSGWTHGKYRGATLRAVVSLFGANSPECATVKAAWNAVSVPVQAGEPACGVAPQNDFSLSLNPTAGSVRQGSSATTTVATQVTSGTAQTVTLAASGLPAGVTATFSPSSVTAGGSSTLTLTANATASTGSKTVTVTGTGGGVSHTATYTLTVTTTQPGNTFSVSLAPGAATVAPGSSTTATVSTATTGGSAQPVALSVSGAPTGVTATVSPSSVTSGGSATLTVAVAATAAAGSYTLTVTGSGTSSTQAATFALTVSGGTPPGCGGVAPWSATTSYVPGDRASYNGHLWNSTWYSTGAEPGAPGSWAVWTDAGTC
jgi:Zn-dependent metalloprotease